MSEPMTLSEAVEIVALERTRENSTLRAEVADRNDAMAEALEILDDYGRTNPTLPAACAELMRHHTALRLEHANLERKVAEWHDEVRRFNAGHARHAEPYSNLEDEFEQMGWAWANVRQMAKLKAEVAELRNELSSEASALRLADDEVERLRAALTWVRSNPGKGSLVVIDYIDDALRGKEENRG